MCVCVCARVLYVCDVSMHVCAHVGKLGKLGKLAHVGKLGTLGTLAFHCKRACIRMLVFAICLH
jgi:hypothetical protein